MKALFVFSAFASSVLACVGAYLAVMSDHVVVTVLWIVVSTVHGASAAFKWRNIA